jgi:hypothetical protein
MILASSGLGDTFFMVFLGCFVLVSLGFAALASSEDRKRLRNRERQRRDYWGYE